MDSTTSVLIKLVQTQLKRKGLQWTRQQIRDWLEANPDVSADDVVETICRQPVTQQEEVTDIALTEEKAAEIKAVASQMQIDLPVEAIQEIASSVNYAIASRAEFLQELRGAIRIWANHVSQKLQEDTEQVFGEIGDEVKGILATDNRRIENKSRQLKADIEGTVKTFREAKEGILASFKL
jgi:hypothetical protein